ncbi:MAG: zinc ribbon domain-containing protein [bacterium]
MNIPFTDNYEDLSNDTGYQFKFNCQKCGNGYMSSFDKSSTGMITGVLGAFSSLLGGRGSSLASTSDQVQRMVAGPQHDKALQKAVEEIRPQFVQCKRCGKWLCKEICWNAERGLCKDCAPILGEEMASAQATHSKDEAWAHARMSSDEKHLGEEDWNDQKKVACPKCGAAVKAHTKFCGDCGAALDAKTECPQCQAKLEPGQKFCAGCGAKIA